MVMAPEHRFSWKVLFALWIASILCVLAIIPYVLTLQAPTLAKTIFPVPLERLIPLQVLQNAVVFAVAVGQEMFVSHRIRLGAPHLEAFFKCETIASRIKSITLISIALSVISGVAIVLLDELFYFNAGDAG